MTNDVNPKMGQCPNCKQSNALTRSHCDFCGLRLPWMETQKAVVPSAGDSAPPPSRRPSLRSTKWKPIAGVFCGVIGLLTVLVWSSRTNSIPDASDVGVGNGNAATTQVASAVPTTSPTQNGGNPSLAEGSDLGQAAVVPARSHTVTFRVSGKELYSLRRSRLAGDKFIPGKGSAVGPPQIASIMITGGGTLSPGMAERLPWSTTFTVQDAYLRLNATTDPLLMSKAANKAGLRFMGTLVAEIIVDGTVVRQRESSGEVGSVEVEYVVGQDPRTAENVESTDRQNRTARIAELRDDIAQLERRKERILSEPGGFEATKNDIVRPLDDQIREKQQQIDRLIVS